ncbi:MAG TPA: hypothetical protein VHD56_17535 [Tepidisphaeraceae bacterium]|jgi:hypothetical protein|nr:hypothetical protein [Tepidisphaeraceae bacterium]
MPVPPLKCISIILCERVYRIEGTPGNLMIVNAFHALSIPKFPCMFGTITVLYTVTEGHGTYDMVLSLVDARTGREVKNWKDKYRVTDPLTVGDVQMILHDVPLPEPGKYLFELKCNDDLISSRPFYVNVAKPRRK